MFCFSHLFQRDWSKNLRRTCSPLYVLFFVDESVCCECSVVGKKSYPCFPGICPCTTTYRICRCACTSSYCRDYRRQVTSNSTNPYLEKFKVHFCFLLSSSVVLCPPQLLCTNCKTYYQCLTYFLLTILGQRRSGIWAALAAIDQKE